MLKDKSLTYVTLFSSAGVGCHGFQMEGYHCIATNEIIERRMQVQRYNHKCEYDSGYIAGDITSEDIKQRIYDEIHMWEKKGNDRVDVIIATPPCQGISVINHKKNDKEINRNSLVVESVEIIHRPVTIDRKKYVDCKTEFNKTQGKYFDMLLEVLTEFYPIEYEMLKYIAMEDMETFNYFANEDFSMVQHLIGYGIISKVDDYYDFQIDVIKEYLLQKENLSKKMITKEDKWSHLCSKRGNFEIEMRKMVKRVLFMSFIGNELEAKEFVMSKIYNDRDSRRKYALYTFNDLFDPTKSLIYLKNLTTLILAKWQVFSPFMKDIKQEDFINMMGILNAEGRFEAHAKIPDESDMVLFDAAITKLTYIMDEYNKIFL